MLFFPWYKNAHSGKAWSSAMGKLLYSPELEKLSLRSTSTIILAQLPQSSPLDFVSTQSNVIDQLLAPCFVSFCLLSQSGYGHSKCCATCFFFAYSCSLHAWWIHSFQTESTTVVDHSLYRIGLQLHIVQIDKFTTEKSYWILIH